MARNLASKFSPKVDERFSIESVTEKALNKEYDWDGVDTVKVYSIPTAELNNYTRSGTNRYGTPADLDDNVQTMKVEQDKSFTYVIDKGDSSSQLTVKNANKSLKRQIRDKIVPYVDTYRITTWATAATANSATKTEAITENNAYAEFLAGRKWLVNKKVPTKGRLCYASADFINMIQLDNRFNKDSDKGMDMNINGFAGKANGVTFIEVPEEYLPANVNYVLTHPVASCAPKKLEDYKIHKDPPGLSGHLVEGRLLHDCFVLDNKKDAIFVHKSA